MTNPKVDLKDLKILQMLDKNARMPFSQIGRVIGLPESVVRYRVERMEKTGIIRGYLAFIDADRLGYRFHNIFLKLKVMSEEKEAKLIKKIEEMRSVCWLASTAGQYNLIISILAKDTHHVEQIYNEIMKLLENNIVDDAIFMATDAYQLPYPLIEGHNPIIAHNVSIGKDRRRPHLDALDLKILYELALNCRITNLELSRKLAIGIDKITEHVDSLLESNIVQGFKPLLDMEKLGKSWYILLFKLKYIDEEAKKHFVEVLKQIPETFFIVNGVGNFGMQVEFFCEDHTKFREMLTRIFPSENSEIVKEYTELKVIKEHKCFFHPVEINHEMQTNLNTFANRKKDAGNTKLERFV